MSKYNKPYHNYNNYSNNKPEVEEAVVEEVEVTETTEMEAVTEPTPAAEVSTPETTEETKPVEPVAEVKESTPTIGVVNCKLLRMREAANTDADVICELPEGTEVQIDKVSSTTDFYKVTTTAGAEGFCMKKFITIK